jgi:crossover junction endonuclease MUS81
MKLIIDNREKKLITYIENINKSKYTIEIKPLDIGDAIIYDNENVPIIIFERKSVSDLASSICDGRYKEQSMRLDSNNVNNHNIFYIIEGSIDKFNSKFSRIKSSSLYSSLCSLSYYKGFSVLTTQNINETGNIIFRFLDKISREKKEPYNKNKTDNNEKTNEKIGSINSIKIVTDNNIETKTYKHNEEKYSEVIKQVKKHNITKENIGEIILSQIPGISNKSAIIIMKHYGTIRKLMEYFQNNENYVLETLYIETKDGKKRKLNKNISEKIREYLLY